MKRARTYKPRPPAHRDAPLKVTRVDHERRAVCLYRGKSRFFVSIMDNNEPNTPVQLVPFNGGYVERKVASDELRADLRAAARDSWNSPHRQAAEE
jgi:hypothetical protein